MTAPTPLTLPVPRLVLWRHGRTEWNAIGRFQGQADPPLDDEGRRQAQRVAPHLVAGGLSGQDTVVISSDLARATETAAPLAALLGVSVRLDRRLREHSLGCWEGLTREEVSARYPDQFADWLAGRPVRGRGGEDPSQVGSRALAALADLPPAAVAVVVTHGGTAGRLLEGLLQLGPEHGRVFGPLANCAWSELTYHSTRWRVIRHNASVLPSLDGRADRRHGPRERGATPEEGAPVPAGDADAVG